MTIQLAITRHGHTQWNRDGRIQGHTDIPLAQDVVDDLSGYRLPSAWQHATLVSSPLCRATQTAQLISGRAPQIENALIEMNWGEWEGQRSCELGADDSSGFRHVDEWGWHFRPSEGESPSEVRARLMPWLRTLQQDTVAVCHIGVMRVLLAVAHKWEFLGPAPFEIKRKRLYVLNVGETIYPADPPVVRLVNTVE